MTAMLKVKARWHGFTGSPGYSNFFFREWSDGNYVPTQAEAAGCTGKVWNFFDAIKLAFPPVVNIQVESDVEVVNDTDNQLITVLNDGGRPNIVGTSGGTNYSAASGAVIGWQTGSVRNGRRVRGRTFLVPTSAAVFDINGTLTSSWVTTLQNAAAAMVAPAANSPDFGIYCRPSSPTVNDGAWFLATGARVPDMAAVLRSRRD